jgi:sugar lactone lactonase YvrE
MSWVNGITTAPDGSLYITDNDWVRKVDSKGAVTTVQGPIKLTDCTNALPDVPPLPYLRGLAVARDGTIYAAANGCRSVIAISPAGAIRTVLRAEAPWSPTGVVLSGTDLYVLEYLHTAGDDRKAWLPRVRKVSSDGKVTTVATVNQ